MNIIGYPPIKFAQFSKVGLTIAQATSVKINEKAKVPAYSFTLNLGDALNAEHKKLTNKQYTSSAQLRSNHTQDELSNQFLMCVYNFPRKQIGPLMSDCLVTGAQTMSGDVNEKRESTVCMIPSSRVAAGAKIGILAEDEVYATNSRTLSWVDFASLDLRIGTIVSANLASEEEIDDSKEPGAPDYQRLYQLNMDVRFGDSDIRQGVGYLKSELSQTNLTGRQVMFLINLDPDEIAQCFNGSKATVVLCTVAGRALLQPKKPVEDGFKIA